MCLNLCMHLLWSLGTYLGVHQGAVRSSDLPFASQTSLLPTGASIKSQEQELLYKILRNYDRAARPVRTATQPVIVKLGLTLTNIFDVDEKNQVIRLNVWLDQEWNDEFIAWNAQDNHNIVSLMIPCDMIWLPDIVLYNNADDYTRGYMRSRAMVYNDGTVFWPPPIQVRSTCKIDVSFFPFDSQLCFLKFGSWVYNGFQLDIINRSENIDLTNFVKNGEFDLVEVRQKRRVIKYSCCAEPYPDMMFFIHLRRKSLYYMYNLVFPCMMMSGLTLLVFSLPPDSGEKIALGITVLLTFSVFMLSVSEKMPETSDSMPLVGCISRRQESVFRSSNKTFFMYGLYWKHTNVQTKGIYLTLIMAMTATSVVMTVMVLSLHHRESLRRRPVPYWLRRLVLVQLRRILCMRPYLGAWHTDNWAVQIQKAIKQEHRIKELRRLSRASVPMSSSIDEFNNARSSSSSGSKLKAMIRKGAKAFRSDSHGASTTAPILMVNDHAKADCVEERPSKGCSKRSGRDKSNSVAAFTTLVNKALPTSNSKHPNYGTNGPPTLKSRFYEKIKNCLVALISRYEIDQETYDMCNEWKEVAETLDRFMFVIFFCATVFITMTLLIFVPVFRHQATLDDNMMDLLSKG